LTVLSQDVENPVVHSFSFLNKLDIIFELSIEEDMRLGELEFEKFEKFESRSDVVTYDGQGEEPAVAGGFLGCETSSGGWSQEMKYASILEKSSFGKAGWWGV